MGQFRALRDFHHYSEAQLQEGHHTLRSEIASRGVSVPPNSSEQEVQGILSEHWAEIDQCDWQYGVTFSRLLRYAIVVLCFTLIESNLTRIAREIASRRSCNCSLSGKHAKTLVAEFQKTWTSAGLVWWDDHRWKQVDELRELRHCLVHRHGVPKDDPAEEPNLRQLLQRDAGVRLLSTTDNMVDPDDVGAVVIEHCFCESIIKDLTALVREVFDRAGCFGPEFPVVK